MDWIERWWWYTVAVVGLSFGCFLIVGCIKFLILIWKTP